MGTTGTLSTVDNIVNVAPKMLKTIHKSLTTGEKRLH